MHSGKRAQLHAPEAPTPTYASAARAVCAAVIAAAAWSCGDGIGIPIQAEAPKVIARVDAGSRMRDAGGSAGTAAIDAGRRRSSDAGIRADAGNRIRDVPDIPYCNLAAGWTDEDIASEQTLFQWINEWRASLSMNCGGRGPCGGLRRLQMSPELRCSARRHSFDMAQPGAAFDTIDSKGKTPRDRIESAGLTPRAWGESIAQGSPTNAAQQLVMKAQMATAQSGDAEFINPQYTLVGIGNYGEFWTVDFADL